MSEAKTDENGVPYVRLTHTITAGFGIGLGMALAQLAIVGAILLLVQVFV